VTSAVEGGQAAHLANRGLTKSSKPTTVEPGLPGRPEEGRAADGAIRLRYACLIATFQKFMTPMRSRTVRTTSVTHRDAASRASSGRIPGAEKERFSVGPRCPWPRRVRADTAAAVTSGEN
jgi:hypothetical protein